MLIGMVGDLAVADLLLDHARSLTEPDRPARNGEATLLRAYLVGAAGRVHKAAETARFLHPRSPVVGAEAADDEDDGDEE